MIRVNLEQKIPLGNDANEKIDSMMKVKNGRTNAEQNVEMLDCRLLLTLVLLLSLGKQRGGSD